MDSASDQRSGVFTCWRGNAAGLGGWTFGFTVALFDTTVALPVGPLQDAAKMGVLLSFAAAPIAIVVARMTGVRRRAG